MSGPAQRLPRNPGGGTNRGIPAERSIPMLHRASRRLGRSGNGPPGRAGPRGDVDLLPTSSVNVLIVETDELFLRNLSERLRLEKVQVFEARLEAEARKIVQRKNIDVVLVGMKGFKERGLALLKSIKEARPLTEVILLTHSEDLSLSFSIEGMKLGAFDDLLIPFDLESLLRRIRDACERKREGERARKPVPRGYREKSDSPKGSESKIPESGVRPATKQAPPDKEGEA